MGINIKAVIKGALFSLAATLLFMLIVAVIAYLSKISEGTVTILAYVSMALSVLAGSFVVARAAENRKLLHVLLFGVAYALVLFAVSAVINGFVSFNAHTAAVMGGIFLTSFLGAVLGSK